MYKYLKIIYMTIIIILQYNHKKKMFGGKEMFDCFNKENITGLKNLKVYPFF